MVGYRVSGVVVTLVSNTKPKIHLFVAQVKHSQMAIRHSFKSVASCQREWGSGMCSLQLHGGTRRGLLMCSYSTFYCRSKYTSKELYIFNLPSLCLATTIIPCMQVSDMDFTTPRCKRIAIFQEMNEDNVNIDEGEGVSVAKVTSNENNINADVDIASTGNSW